MFSQVSVCPQGLWVPGQVPPWAGTPPRQVHPRQVHPQQVHPPATVHATIRSTRGSTHPTGMHSCLNFLHSQAVGMLKHLPRTRSCPRTTLWNLVKFNCLYIQYKTELKPNGLLSEFLNPLTTLITNYYINLFSANSSSILIWSLIPVKRN